MYEDLKGDIFSQGFHVVPSKVMLSEDLDKVDKIVYIALLGFSVKGKAVVSMSEIADIIKSDRKIVGKHIVNLEDAGLIIRKEIKPKKHKGRFAQSYNEYYIQNEVK